MTDAKTLVTGATALIGRHLIQGLLEARVLARDRAAVRALQEARPGVVLRYAWPFDLGAVARLLADACHVPAGGR